jgi:hypothetical protein
MEKHTHYDHDEVLHAPLHTLRRELDRHNAPPGVEKELMAAFAARFPRKRWYQKLSMAQWGMAGTGSAATAVLALIVTLHAPLPQAPDQAAAFAAAASRDGGAAFIALQPVEQIAQEQSPQVVQTELTGEALAAAGVAVSPEQAGETVLAEMLVSSDGEPLALRILAQ